MVRYYGALGPRSPLRWAGAAGRAWAARLRKIFEVDPVKCVKCGGERNLFLQSAQFARVSSEAVEDDTLRTVHTVMAPDKKRLSRIFRED